MDRKLSRGGRVPAWHSPVPFVAACAALTLLAAPPALAQGVAATGVGSQFELTFWQSVESGSDPALYEAYLAQYPNGTFATVARVKLAKLRQLAAPATPAPLPAPAQQPVLPTPPAQAQIMPAAVVTPVTPPAKVLPAPAPTAPSTAAQLAAATPAATPATKPGATPPIKQQLASRATRSAPLPAPKVDSVPKPDPDSAPYVTTLPQETEPESSDSDALRRLLGALGDSQRLGAVTPSPIVDTADVAPAGAVIPAPPSAPLTPSTPPAPQASLALPETQVATPAATPSASPSRLVETGRVGTGGRAVAVPDAVQLSLTSTPATDLHPIAVGLLPPDFRLPPRPQLAAIPPLIFPPSFCSAEARNAFHDGPYVTAVEVAKRNNDATIAYMRQLQDLYDTNQLRGDTNPVNAVAAESQSYSPVAAAAFTAQSILVSAFSTLMAVPIRACEAPKQP